MLLRCHHDFDWKKIPARQLLAAGLLLVALGASWPHSIGAHGWLAPTWNDFAQGFCYGVGIGVELLALYVMRRQRRPS